MFSASPKAREGNNAFKFNGFAFCSEQWEKEKYRNIGRLKERIRIQNQLQETMVQFHSTWVMGKLFSGSL